MSELVNDQSQATEQASVSSAPVQPTQKQPTSAADFRRAAKERTDGTVVELSSGNSLVIARPSVNNLVKTGQLPSELANAAIKVQSGGGVINDHDMKKYVEYNERIVKLSVKSPAIVDNPREGENEISIDDLSDDERNEILLYVNGGLEALSKFRSERSGVSS